MKRSWILKAIAPGEGRRIDSDFRVDYSLGDIHAEMTIEAENLDTAIKALRACPGCAEAFIYSATTRKPK